MAQINGSEGFANERTSERIDWCTDVTDELGWQTATRRKPRNQPAPGSGLRPTALSFEPSNMSFSTSSRSGVLYNSQPHNSQPLLKGFQSARKGYQNRYEKPSSITEFDGNVESRQGNIRGRRQIRDDTKVFNSANGTTNTGYKKIAPKPTKNNESSLGDTAAIQDCSHVSMQEVGTTTSSEHLKKAEKPEALSCPESKKEYTSSPPVPSQQPAITATGKKSKKSKKKNAGKKASLKVDNAALDIDGSEKKDKAVGDKCKESVKVCLEEKLKVHLAGLEIKPALRFGDASQIASVIRLPKPRSSAYSSKFSGTKREFLSKQKATKSSRPIRLPLTMPSIVFSARSRELAPAFLDLEETFPTHNDSNFPDCSGIESEIVTQSAPLNPTAPEFSQELHLIAPAITLVPEDSQPEQHALEESKVSHLPPPAEWPTFVPASQSNISPSAPKHQKKVSSGHQHNLKHSIDEARASKESVVPDAEPVGIKLQKSDLGHGAAIKPQEDCTSNLGEVTVKAPDQSEALPLATEQGLQYSAPTLEDLKNSGGLIESLPQHCQPVYAAGHYPSEPPSRLADGFMYCEDQIDRRFFASNAFIEPNLDQLLFPKSYSAGKYALAIVLVKQITFTRLDENEQGGTFTDRSLKYEVSKMVYEKSGLNVDRVRIMLVHDVRTPIFPNMAERDVTRFLSGMSKERGTCIVYHLTENMNWFIRGKLEQAAADPNCAAIVGVGSYWTETLPLDISEELSRLHQNKLCLPVNKVLAIVHDSLYTGGLTITHPPHERYGGQHYVHRMFWQGLFNIYRRINSFESIRYRIDDDEPQIQRLLQRSKPPCFDFFTPFRLECSGMVPICPNGDNCEFSHSFSEDNSEPDVHEFSFLRNVLSYMVHRPTCHEHWCRDIFCRFNHDQSKSWNDLCSMIFDKYHSPSYPYNIKLVPDDKNERLAIVCTGKKE